MKKSLRNSMKGVVCMPDDDIPGWLADFGQQIREEDCKAVCDGCAHPESMKVKAAELSPSKKTWVHYFLDGNGHYICDAAAIRNLAEKEPT